MKVYSIKWKKSAVKELQSLQKEIAINILQSVDELANNPRPATCKKLKALANHYQIRINDYRVVYSIIDNVLLIEIVKVAHRKEVYR